MLSAALRAAPHSIGQPMQPARLPPGPILTQPQSLPRSLGSRSFSDAESMGPLFESPRPAHVGIPAPSRASVFDADDEALSASHGDDELFGEELEVDEPHAPAHPSASSSQTQNGKFSFLSPASVLGPLASGAGTPGLQSAGPSGDFTIGRAAMSIRGSMGDMQAELEHLSSCAGARGSRPIGIPRAPFAATYSPSAGAFMAGFVPPHELAAASMQDADPMVVHSHRHKSTAERLRTAMFEQTGVVSMATATSFLHQQQPFPSRR